MIECFHPLRLTFSPYKKTKTVPLLFDFRSTLGISLAAAHLKESISYRRTSFDIGTDHYGRPEFFKIKNRQVVEPKLTDIHRTLAKLGVKSFFSKNSGWMTVNERFKERQETFDLPSDRYAGLAAGVYNSGSSRHCFIGPLQLKGTGRNRLSSRNDFAHNSGFLTLPQAVMEYVLCHYLNSFLPLGAGAIPFVSVYPKSRTLGFPHALLGRERPPLRHAHITPGNWLPGEFAAIRKSLKAVFKSIHAERVVDQLILQNAVSFIFGVFQGSIIPDNFTLISSYIDLSTMIRFPGQMSLGLNFKMASSGKASKVGVISLNNMASLIDYSLIGAARFLNEFLIGEIDLDKLPEKFVDRVYELQTLLDLNPKLSKKELRHLLEFRHFGSIGLTARALQVRADKKSYDAREIFRYCTKLPKFQMSLTPLKHNRSTVMLRLQGSFAFSGRTLESAFNARDREGLYHVIDSSLMSCLHSLRSKKNRLYSASALVNSSINDLAYINPFDLDSQGRLVRQITTLRQLWKQIKLLMGTTTFLLAEVKVFYDGHAQTILVDLESFHSFQRCFPRRQELIVFNLALRSTVKGVWIVPVFKPRIVASN